MPDRPVVVDLGVLPYTDAYEVQCVYAEQVIAARDGGAAVPGWLLLLEHAPPVVTVPRRSSAPSNLLVTPDEFARAGVEVVPTDRGGDVTYHGPGQLVVYAILDLNYYKLGLHDYMRLLERVVIDTCRAFGVEAERDPAATGAWVRPSTRSTQHADSETSPAAKIGAMGVRVRRWVSMHGLALNVTTNLDHFSLIVPCGLRRPVTSLARELGSLVPTMGEVKRTLARCFGDRLELESRSSNAQIPAEPPGFPNRRP